LTAAFDLSLWGSHAPRGVDRAVLAMTRAMPNNWLGLRLAMALRKIVMSHLGDGALDTMLWNMRLRLYPRRNGCEKNALFTPQMFDVMERRVLADAVRQRLDARANFTFVDVGANVGLYSLFVTACGGTSARVLAIEPQPGILDRLRFHLAANALDNIDVLACALGDRSGEATLIINDSDSGGTHLDKEGLPAADGRRVSVPCKPLTDVLKEAKIAAIDALKIDVEGAEDLVLAPFLRDAPRSLLPRLILIEDTRGVWNVDLFALMAERGYAVAERSRQNVALRLD
jgi:FkbM family methyltransferase